MRRTMPISVPAMFKWLLAFIVGQWLLLPDATREVFLALVFLMMLDWVSGVCSGAVRRKLSSEVGANGLIRKGLIMVLLLSVMILERIADLLGANLSGLRLELVGAVGFSLNEVISIMENCAKAGVPIPPQLRRMLLAVQKLKGTDIDSQELSHLRAGVRNAQADLDRGLDSVKVESADNERGHL